MDRLVGLGGLECIRGRLLDGQDCKFAPILQCLVVEDGTLQGPHTQGLAACAAMVELIFEQRLLIIWQG